MQHTPGPGRKADVSFKALLMAGSLCALSLWWSWPRFESQKQLHAESSNLVQFEPRALPDFQLQGPEKNFNRQSLKGQWTLLYFAYARCTDTCQTTLGALATLHRSLVAAGHANILQTAVVSIAADDDPQRIQDYVESFDNSFMGFSGAWEEREKLFLFFDVGVDSAVEEGSDLYYHSPNIYLIDPEGQFVAFWSRVPERWILREELCHFMNCHHG